MTNIVLTLSGATARATVTGPLTSGMTGIPVTMEYDEAWSGLTKNLVCRCGQWGPDKGETRTVHSIGNTATVSHEVMQAGMYLYLGVEGYSADGDLVIPSTWAECGKILPGANANADPSTSPKLPFWAQLQTEITKVKSQAVTENRVAAIVAAQLKETPMGDPDSSRFITLPVDEAGNPVHGAAGWYAVSDGNGGITWAESAPVTHSIRWNLVNAISSNPLASVNDGAYLSAKLTAANGYRLGAVTVTMGGQPLDGAWNASAATVTIASVTGDVTISCTGIASGSGDSTDTSPVIEQSGYALGTSAPAEKSWGCYTVAYPMDGSVNRTLKHHLANYDGISMGQYSKAHALKNGELIEYYSFIFAESSESGENTTLTETRFGEHDSMKFTLVEAYKEDSYLYIEETGEIIFAGKNTPYYGMANIDGTTAGSGNSSATIAEEVDNAVMMLSLSAGETAVASDYPNLDADYVATVQANYDAMMAECLGDYTKIPLIISADQHGDLSNGKGGNILKLIGTVTNWYEIGKCINLGDTCGNTFTESTLQTYLSNMAKYVPLTKRVEVYGNHDIWDADSTQKYTVNQKRLSPYFKNINARRCGNNGYFTVTDDYYNVKYLVINNMEYPDTNCGTQRITTAQARFLISELGANDGYDIIILSHIPIDSVEVTLRDGSTGGYNTPFLTDTAANTSFQTMLAARKNRTSGVFTDSEGAENAYDFTNTTGEILMSLHGHDHHEAHKTMTCGITEFLCDCMKDYDTLFYFAYIDRENKKFKYWRNEIDADAREISIS